MQQWTVAFVLPLESHMCVCVYIYYSKNVNVHLDTWLWFESAFSCLFHSRTYSIHVYTLILSAVFWLTLHRVLISPLPALQGSATLRELHPHGIMSCTAGCAAMHMCTRSPKLTYGVEEVSLLIHSRFSFNIIEENRELTYETGLKYYFSSP